LLKIKLIIRE